jgi:hypothetical protein
VTTTATDALRRLTTWLPIYPVALAGVLLFQLVATSGVGVWVSFRPLAIALLIGLVVTAAIRIILGDVDRSGPPAAIIILAIMEGGDRRILALAILVTAIFFV